MLHFGRFCIFSARISVMDNKIIKTKLKFVFSIVELPKLKTKQSNILILQNSNSPHQIYPKSQKSPQKSSFGRFSFFTVIFWQSDIWFRFGNSAQQHRTGSNGVSLDRAHFGDRKANRFPCSEIPGQLKVQICHFLAVFRPWPHLDTWPLTLKLCFLKAATDTHILAKFQFSSFTLTRSKTAVTESARDGQSHYLDFFGRFFDGIGGMGNTFENTDFTIIADFTVILLHGESWIIIVKLNYNCFSILWFFQLNILADFISILNLEFFLSKRLPILQFYNFNILWDLIGRKFLKIYALVAYSIFTRCFILNKILVLLKFLILSDA